jgi:EpsI family protein
MTARVLILSICLLAGSGFLAVASQTETTVIREGFDGFPLQIGEWKGRDIPIDKDVLDVLRVDDYLSRGYASNAGVIGLYVGFYQTQRQGSAIHSPLNCLPGAGWNPIRRSYLNLSAGAKNIEVNRITIQKGAEKQVVLYWYQAHGRIVASEYWGKFYSVLDAIRINRTDAALVRIIRPIYGTDAEAESAAEASAVGFVQSLFPLLSRHLPD